MDDVKCGEVAEGRCGENAVAVVQRVDVQNTQVQQLQHTGQKGQYVFFRRKKEKTGSFFFFFAGMKVPV